MAIKVRAINPGLYGKYHEVGTEFSIKDEKHFSSRWMEKLDADEAEPKGKVKKVKASAKPEEEEADEADSEVI